MGRGRINSPDWCRWTLFYDPTPEHLTRLSSPWCGSFSGGKDSGAMVTLLEYWRRKGWITADRPCLVQSDTTVEDAALSAVASELRKALEDSGWTCAVVTPRINEKLYNRILGIGNTPVHQGGRKMRWCTRSTKIDPMDRWRAVNAGGLVLTGRRLGESTHRDEKIARHSCGAGGECGIPDAGPNTFDPIIRWSLCQVIDWLSGHVAKSVRSVMSDIFPVTQKLVDVYHVVVSRNNFAFADPDVEAGRFGCHGCPAIGGHGAPKATVRRNGVGSPLNELHDVMDDARKRRNRLYAARIGKKYGPIKMAVRKALFARVMDIQRRAGVVLITRDDEAFIRACWANKVYPRGWSEEDEATEPPCETPLLNYHA